MMLLVSLVVVLYGTVLFGGHARRFYRLCKEPGKLRGTPLLLASLDMFVVFLGLLMVTAGLVMVLPLLALLAELLSLLAFLTADLLVVVGVILEIVTYGIRVTSNTATDPLKAAALKGDVSV